MAKRVPPLTALGIARVKPDPSKTIELVDGAEPGLRLRITPNGTRTWSLNIRRQGVMRRFGVGKGLGLEEARKEARLVRAAIEGGQDPTADKRAIRMQATAAKQGIGTLRSVIDAYFEVGAGTAMRTKGEQVRRTKSVFATHLTRAAMEITSAELQRTIDVHKGKVSAARATAYLLPVIKWAVKRDLMKGHFDLDKPLMAAPKQRVLDTTELASLLPSFTDAYGRCCRFMLLTGARLRARSESS